MKIKHKYEAASTFPEFYKVLTMTQSTVPLRVCPGAEGTCRFPPSLLRYQPRAPRCPVAPHHPLGPHGAPSPTAGLQLQTMSPSASVKGLCCITFLPPKRCPTLSAGRGTHPGTLCLGTLGTCRGSQGRSTSLKEIIVSVLFLVFSISTAFLGEYFSPSIGHRLSVHMCTE